MPRNVHQIKPNIVTYRGHTIKLTHRPKVNDWQYHITYHIPLTLSDHAPRYEQALAQAKQEIDALMEKQV